MWGFPEAPCRRCEFRGCGAKHDSCGKYMEWCEQNNRMKEVYRNERLYDNLAIRRRLVTLARRAKKGGDRK